MTCFAASDHEFQAARPPPLLKKQGFRLTSQRAIILETVSRHGHVMFRSCDRVFVFDLKIVESLAKAVNKSQDLELDVDHLTLGGLCKSCRKG